MVNKLEKNSRLSIPEKFLEPKYSKILQALISVGIISKHSGIISFRHQALFDYQIGIKLYNYSLESSKELIQEIGGFSQQTLTKREHLKYALNMLQEFSQEKYCNIVEAILNSYTIRFHLKHLALSSIRELSDIKKPAKEMLAKISSITSLLTIFISKSCHGNKYIIEHLSKEKFISKWLNSKNAELIDKNVDMLCSVSDQAPDLVLKELNPFIGKSKKWNNRVYIGLGWLIERDSDEIFKTRKKLVKLGFIINFVDWKKLSNENPVRVLDLFELAINQVNSPYNYSVDTDMITKLEDLYSVAQTIPATVISTLLSTINNFLKTKLIIKLLFSTSSVYVHN